MDVNKFNGPLSRLYSILFLIGGGDTNPGNICIRPCDVCAEKTQLDLDLRFGTFDIDLAFKTHAGSHQFDEHKKYCESFLNGDPAYYKGMSKDKCARNVLHYYGKNPIAIQERHQTEIKYFLETGDSGLRDKDFGRSAYTGYLGKRGILFDPYNCKKYCENPPFYAKDISLASKKIIDNIVYEELEKIIKYIFKKTKGRLDEINKTTDFFAILEKHALNIVRIRYDVLKCYASNAEELSFTVLENKCHVEKYAKTELEDICDQDVKKCHKKIKEILDISQLKYFVKTMSNADLEEVKKVGEREEEQYEL